MMRFKLEYVAMSGLSKFSQIPQTPTHARVGQKAKLCFSGMLALLALAQILYSCQRSPTPPEIVQSLLPELTSRSITAPEGEIKRSESDSTSTTGNKIKLLNLNFQTRMTSGQLRENITNLLTQRNFRQTVNVNAPASFLLEFVSLDGKITIKLTASAIAGAMDIKSYAEKVKAGEIKPDETGTIPPPISSSVQITISYTLK